MSPSLIVEPLPTATLGPPPQLLLVSIIIANSSSSISPRFLQIYSSELFFLRFNCYWEVLYSLLQVLAQSYFGGFGHIVHYEKGVLWVSPCNENPIICQKVRGKNHPCLSPGALATPNSRFSQVHATERAEGWGVIWGYFHIFTIFRPDLLGYLEQH